MKKLSLSMLIVFLLALGLASVALADDGKNSANSRPVGVYVVHGIPGVTVDVYVDGRLALKDFKPNDVVGPVNMPIGCCRHIAIYAAGANPAEAQPVLHVTAPLPTARFVTVIAHLSATGTPTISMFRETPETRAPRGYGKLNVRHTAAFGAVDLWAAPASGGELTKIASGLTNPKSLDLVLPAGQYRVAVTPAGAGPESAALSATLTVIDRETFNVYAIGAPLASPSTFGAIVQRLR